MTGTTDPTSGGGRERFDVIDLAGDARDRALIALRESFTGIYRWHAKRTLREISSVRAVEIGGAIVGASMLERLAPEVGYVYYLFVAREFRGRGIARVLLDDALGRFRGAGAEVVYAACESENEPVLRLFRSRGFREVQRKEPGFREGGLGAWGYRSRMRIVPGEILLGLRLRDPTGTTAAEPAGDRPYPPT
ncbi:MAG: GNAT family N-acetyltransferase [Thermoplasmata archaeon]